MTPLTLTQKRRGFDSPSFVRCSVALIVVAVLLCAITPAYAEESAAKEGFVGDFFHNLFGSTRPQQRELDEQRAAAKQGGGERSQDANTQDVSSEPTAPTAAEGGPEIVDGAEQQAVTEATQEAPEQPQVEANAAQNAEGEQAGATTEAGENAGLEQEKEVLEKEVTELAKKKAEMEQEAEGGPEKPGKVAGQNVSESEHEGQEFRHRTEEENRQHSDQGATTTAPVVNEAVAKEQKKEAEVLAEEEKAKIEKKEEEVKEEESKEEKEKAVEGESTEQKDDEKKKEEEAKEVSKEAEHTKNELTTGEPADESTDEAAEVAASQLVQPAGEEVEHEKHMDHVGHGAALRKVEAVHGPYAIQDPEAWSYHEYESLDKTLNGQVNRRDDNLQDQINALRDAVEGILGKHGAPAHHGECASDQQCPEGTYCALLSAEEEASTSSGYCLKKYDGFCRSNSDCEGDDLFCEMDSETAYGTCHEKLSVYTYSPHESHAATSEDGGRTVTELEMIEAMEESFSAPEIIDLGPTVAPEAPLSLTTDLAETAPAPPTGHTDAGRGLRAHGERREALLAANSCQLRTWKTCGFDASNLDTNCDDPMVRDSAAYQDSPDRRLMVTVAFHAQAPSVEERREAHRAELTQAVKGVVETLAGDFNRHGIFFAPRLYYWKSNTYATGDAKVSKSCPARAAAESEDESSAPECVTPDVFIEGLKRASTETSFFTNGINIFVVTPLDDAAFGHAYYPWDLPAPKSNAGSGTVVIAHGRLRKGDHTASHLMGHALGLYHVFHGTASEDMCVGCHADTHKPDCYERSPSDITGDMCSDTPPTPRLFGCATAAARLEIDSCTGRAYSDLADGNIMSYQGDECRRQFTPQQVRRMRCWAQAGLATRHFTAAQCRNKVLGRWEPCNPRSIHASAQRRTDAARVEAMSKEEKVKDEVKEKEKAAEGEQGGVYGGNGTEEAAAVTDAKVKEEEATVVEGKHEHSLHGAIAPPHESSRATHTEAPAAEAPAGDSGEKHTLHGAIPPPEHMDQTGGFNMHKDAESGKYEVVPSHPNPPAEAKINLALEKESAGDKMQLKNDGVHREEGPLDRGDPSDKAAEDAAKDAESHDDVARDAVKEAEEEAKQPEVKTNVVPGKAAEK